MSQLIAPVWPLHRWGIHKMGPLTPAQGNYRFAIVAVEYFSKWIEARPVTNISAPIVKKLS